MAKQTSGIKIVAQNKKVRKLYDLLETLEAGLVLTGSEIKSVRAGKVSFKDSYIAFRAQEAYVVGLHIAIYENAGYAGHQPERERKLLLHKREIEHWQGKVEQKGLTVVPTKVYLKNSRAKLEIALAKGRKVFDQREELKRRAMQRDLAREVAKFKG